jgi:cytochrome c nitrite reductase small subunit
MLKPPQRWKLPVIIFLGIIIGLSIYLFKISNAVSYLSESPSTCMNCHVMTPQYASWFHSSHRENATCNDCHVPHNNLVNKYFFKMKDGLRHSTIFSLRTEPQVIQIKDAGLNVVQENCKRCHENVNYEVNTINITGKNYKNGDGKLCWECHREVPHGTVTSLSSTPNAIVPKLDSPVPEWLQNILNMEKE